MLSVLRFVFHTSTFLPTFPRHGFAFRASRGSSPLQYYAGSDSCPALARQTGLFAYSALPSGHPIPTHVMCLERRFRSHLSASNGPSTGSRLRQPSRARQHTPPKRVRHPTGYPFASGYFPPRLAATQLPSASCNVTSHGQDLHLTDRAYSRTYEGRRPRRPKVRGDAHPPSKQRKPLTSASLPHVRGTSSSP